MFSSPVIEDGWIHKRQWSTSKCFTLNKTYASCLNHVSRAKSGSFRLKWAISVGFSEPLIVSNLFTRLIFPARKWKLSSHAMNRMKRLPMPMNKGFSGKGPVSWCLPLGYCATLAFEHGYYKSRMRTIRIRWKRPNIIGVEFPSRIIPETEESKCFKQHAKYSELFLWDADRKITDRYNRPEHGANRCFGGTDTSLNAGFLKKKNQNFFRDVRNTPTWLLRAVTDPVASATRLTFVLYCF